MITAERLKELIEQGATIYDIFNGDIYLVDLTMAKYYDVPKYIEYKNDYYNCNLTRSIDDLFETKEEAEWELEFGNITRTETLRLPTWEECKKKAFTLCFYRNTKEYGIHRCQYSADENNPDLRIEIYVYYLDSLEEYSETLFSKPLTKENYIEACRLAKKLFLDGKDE